MQTNGFHPAPQWLTKEYFSPILRSYKKDDTLAIKEFHLKPATAKGENYASVMTRIEVSYSSGHSTGIQQESYIAKTTYENDPYTESVMQPYQTFATEMQMYEEILPKISQLLRQLPGGGDAKLFADTVYVDYKHTAIIFTDLAVEHFMMADRLIGLDMKHTKFVLKNLAKMHAAAAVLNEKSPNILTKFDHGVLNRHTEAFTPLFVNMFAVCAEFAGECPELGAYYKEKLLRLRDNVMEYGARVVDRRNDMFLTLNHGDCWTNNMMFRYTLPDNAIDEPKTIRDIRFIDFQFCTWASPAVDLHYFLNISPQSDVRFNHEDALIQHYHRILSESLRSLNYRGHIPSLRQFVLQMELGRFYAVAASIVIQPMVLTNQTDNAEFKALLIDDEPSRNYRRLLYANEIIQKRIAVLLPYFDRIGLLDPEQ